MESRSGHPEIVVLLEEASRLLGSPEGQKILREINAFDALAHSDRGWIDPLNEGEKYSTDDYLEHPDRFSIAGFYPAVYFVEDDILLTTENPLAHRTRLEKQIAEEMPDLHSRLQKLETRVVAGDTFKVRDTNIQFFAIKGEPDLHSKRIPIAVIKQLAERGILLLFWGEDMEWEKEQVKNPMFARYVAYKKRVDEAKGRFQLFAELQDILDDFGGHSPEGPEKKYKWSIIRS